MSDRLQEGAMQAIRELMYLATRYEDENPHHFAALVESRQMNDRDARVFLCRNGVCPNTTRPTFIYNLFETLNLLVEELVWCTICGYTRAITSNQSSVDGNPEFQLGLTQITLPYTGCIVCRQSGAEENSIIRIP